MPVSAPPKAHRTSLKDRALFLRRFLQTGTRVASVAPSSRWLSAAMVKDIPFETANVIVELGAGTGPVTAELFRRVRPGCRLLIVERDPEFVEVLRRRFPSAEIVRHDACALDEILESRGLSHVDHIVNCLPTPSLPAAGRERLFRSVTACLSPHGTYCQLTEIPLVYLRFYKKYFHDVSFRFVLRNVPPGGCYVCRGPKPAA